MSSFQAAIELLMKVIGLKFRLNRITILRTEVAEQKTDRIFQWVSEEDYRLLIDEIHFLKSDFITLFRHNDEYGTVVLQENDLADYSEQGRKNVLQGGAKTVVCAAMYCEGSYIGTIVYVTCREKRLWSREDRKLLGEVTKIILRIMPRTRHLTVFIVALLQNPDGISLPDCLLFQDFEKMWRKC